MQLCMYVYVTVWILFDYAKVFDSAAHEHLLIKLHLERHEQPAYLLWIAIQSK